MSNKAVGYDWKKRSKLTLRHAAGCVKFRPSNEQIIAKRIKKQKKK